LIDMLKLRKLLILLMLMILPVQGLAAAYGPIHKALAGAGAAASAHGDVPPCHQQQAAHGQQDQSNADGAGHLCCHQVFTGATSSVLAGAARKFSDTPLFVLALYTLFIPDSPDRPPRG
jgi:hypothetical protein